MLSTNRNCGPPKNMIWYQPSCEPAPVWPAPRIPSKYDSTSQDCGRSNVHTLCSNTCLLRKILPSIIVQPKNLKSDESITKRLLKRVSKSIQRIGHKILKSKPCNSQRPNEMTKERYRKHAKTAENKGWLEHSEYPYRCHRQQHIRCCYLWNQCHTTIRHTMPAWR